MPANGSAKPKSKSMPYAVGGFNPLPARAKMQISAREFEVFRGLALRLDKTADALKPKEAATAASPEATDSVRKSKRRKKQTKLLSIGHPIKLERYIKKEPINTQVPNAAITTSTSNSSSSSASSASASGKAADSSSDIERGLPLARLAETPKRDAESPMPAGTTPTGAPTSTPNAHAASSSDSDSEGEEMSLADLMRSTKVKKKKKRPPKPKGAKVASSSSSKPKGAKAASSSPKPKAAKTKSAVWTPEKHARVATGAAAVPPGSTSSSSAISLPPMPELPAELSPLVSPSFPGLASPSLLAAQAQVLLPSPMILKSEVMTPSRSSGIAPASLEELMVLDETSLPLPDPRKESRKRKRRGMQAIEDNKHVLGTRQAPSASAAGAAGRSVRDSPAAVAASVKSAPPSDVPRFRARDRGRNMPLPSSKPLETQKYVPLPPRRELNNIPLDLTRCDDDEEDVEMVSVDFDDDIAKHIQSSAKYEFQDIDSRSPKLIFPELGFEFTGRWLPVFGTRLFLEHANSTAGGSSDSADSCESAGVKGSLKFHGQCHRVLRFGLGGTSDLI